MFLIDSKKIALIWAFFCNMLFACSTVDMPENSVNGIIYDSDNEPVSGAEIFVGKRKKAVSDIYGHFQL